MKHLIGTLALAFALLGCGGQAELSPEIEAHLAEYETLIVSFQPKFDDVRGDRPAFARVADSYGKQAKAWLDGWQTVSPNPTEAEGKAIQARITQLNRRAERMLRGN